MSVLSDFDLQYGGKVNIAKQQPVPVVVVVVVFIVHMFLIRSKQTNRCHLPLPPRQQHSTIYIVRTEYEII